MLICRISDTESTPDIGEELCTNPIVKKVSFTGSTNVGKLLMKMSSDTVKRLSLELGGMSHLSFNMMHVAIVIVDLYILYYVGHLF